jgi:hypothetical protein
MGTHNNPENTRDDNDDGGPFGAFNKLRSAFGMVGSIFSWIFPIGIFGGIFYMLLRSHAIDGLLRHLPDDWQLGISKFLHDHLGIDFAPDTSNLTAERMRQLLVDHANMSEDDAKIVIPDDAAFNHLKDVCKQATGSDNLVTGMEDDRVLFLLMQNDAPYLTTVVRRFAGRASDPNKPNTLMNGLMQSVQKIVADGRIKTLLDPKPGANGGPSRLQNTLGIFEPLMPLKPGALATFITEAELVGQDGTPSATLKSFFDSAFTALQNPATAQATIMTTVLPALQASPEVTAHPQAFTHLMTAYKPIQAASGATTGQPTRGTGPATGGDTAPATGGDTNPPATDGTAEAAKFLSDEGNARTYQVLTNAAQAAGGADAVGRVNDILINRNVSALLALANSGADADKATFTALRTFAHAQFNTTDLSAEWQTGLSSLKDFTDLLSMPQNAAKTQQLAQNLQTAGTSIQEVLAMLSGANEDIRPIIQFAVSKPDAFNAIHDWAKSIDNPEGLDGLSDSARNGIHYLATNTVDMMRAFALLAQNDAGRAVLGNVLAVAAATPSVTPQEKQLLTHNLGDSLFQYLFTDQATRNALYRDDREGLNILGRGLTDTMHQRPELANNPALRFLTVPSRNPKSPFVNLNAIWDLANSMDRNDANKPGPHTTDNRKVMHALAMLPVDQGEELKHLTPQQLATFFQNESNRRIVGQFLNHIDIKTLPEGPRHFLDVLWRKWDGLGPMLSDTSVAKDFIDTLNCNAPSAWSAFVDHPFDSFRILNPIRNAAEQLHLSGGQCTAPRPTPTGSPQGNSTYRPMIVH